jgi:hypothetical protein
VVAVAEIHEEERAVSVVGAEAHHEDEVDPQVVEVASAVVEVVDSVAVAAAAVVSQEVDPQAVVAALAVEASVVAVDEEDTKCFDLGHHVRMTRRKRNRLRSPSQFGTTITYRYHDHLAALWSCNGFWCTMSNIWRHAANS